ncbi:hypothetical protein J6590_093341 [Homalodisca vitripennis]|nr:hypothetical protein J6590_093341 [Homalodisca vitripennis]
MIQLEESRVEPIKVTVALHDVTEHEECRVEPIKVTVALHDVTEVIVLSEFC